MIRDSGPHRTRQHLTLRTEAIGGPFTAVDYIARMSSSLPTTVIIRLVVAPILTAEDV